MPGEQRRGHSERSTRRVPSRSYGHTTHPLFRQPLSKQWRDDGKKGELEVQQGMPLTQEEIDGCREAFKAFDVDRSGTIDVWELRQVLEAMGQNPTEEELFQMISEVDNDYSGTIDFGEFLHVIEKQKERAAKFDDESDMVDAFVACGGNPDKSGHVRRERLVKIIKEDFGLTIDIEQLIDAVDTDGSGEIEYDEFKDLLSAKRPA